MALLEVGAVPADVVDGMVEVAGLGVRLLRKGEGRPLVFLHDSLGNIGWIPVYERLADSYRRDRPRPAGLRRVAAPEWARSPRDLAILTLQLLDRLDARDVSWWASASAASSRPRWPRCTGRWSTAWCSSGPSGSSPGTARSPTRSCGAACATGPAGFRDPESFRALFDVDDVPDDLYQLWDFSTEMTARVCWKPAMFSLELPHLLGEVAVPTAVVLGADDQLFPVDIGHQYVELLPDARLTSSPTRVTGSISSSPTRSADLLSRQGDP